MAVLSFLEYEALRDRALRWGREIANDIKQHITHEIGVAMSALQDALAQLGTDVGNEIAQLAATTQTIADKTQAVADAVAALNASEEEKAQLQAAVADLQAQVDSATTTAQSLSSQLQADDAPPAEPPVA